MLALKLLLLYGLWKAFFSQPILPKMIEGMDPDQVAAKLVAPAPAAPPAPNSAPPAPVHRHTPNIHEAPP